MLEGVCCEFCRKKETGDCPMLSASPWSRWRNWCGEFIPNPKEKEALPIFHALMAAMIRGQIEWSAKTFGDARRTLGITRHIAKELDEIREKPDDLSEWIDVIILAMDGYWRHGGKQETLARDIEAKMAINRGRVYKMPTSEDEPGEHERNGEETTDASSS